MNTLDCPVCGATPAFSGGGFVGYVNAAGEAVQWTAGQAADWQAAPASMHTYYQVSWKSWFCPLTQLATMPLRPAIEPAD